MKAQWTLKVSAFAFVLGLALLTNAANGQTDFTWQGWLVDGTTFLDGQYDLRLRLFDAPEGGSKLGNDVFKQDVTVSNGNFGGTLDFGVDIFDGQVRYVEIAFRLATLNDPYPYKVLNAPRQEVLRTHHTILAENVGIGTGTPYRELDVRGCVRASEFEATNAYGGLSINSYWDRIDGRWEYYSDGSASVIQQDGRLGGLACRVGESGEAGDEITWTTAFSIDPTGNVGIGTPTPAYKLDVVGGARIALVREADANEFTVVDFDGHQALGVYGNGRVGIGTMIPAHKLDVSGNIGCVLLYQTSDERFKTNVTELTSALDKIEKIRGVSFEWNEKAEAIGAQAGQKQIGVVAQEVENVFPEIVASSPEGYKSVDYTKLTAVLIEAVKELKAESRALKADNETLRSRLEALETTLE